MIVVGGKIVYGTDKIQKLSPSAPKARTGRLPIITFWYDNKSKIKHQLSYIIKIMV